MSIATPEIASLCGAVDSDAIVDGQPFGAHYLRPLIRSTNRMIAKAQPLFNLTWPEVTYGEDSLYLFEGVAPLTWTRILPPVPLGHRPGLSLADVWLRMSVPSTYSVEVYLATSQRPMRPYRSPDATIAGTGSFANTTIANIPIAPTGEENLELWIRGVASTDGASTGTFGTPNQRSSVGGTYSVSPAYGSVILSLTTAAWNPDTSANNLASGGHYVAFTDTSGNVALPGRTIVSVPTATSLVLEPGMSSQQAAIARELNEFFVYKLPTYQLTNFGAVALARSA